MKRSPHNLFLDAVANGDDVLLAPLVAQSPLPVADALTIYKGNKEEGLASALANTFNVTQQLVGEEFFRIVALRFQEEHLPEKTNLEYYGENFPAFLEEQSELDELPYLPEVAKLEWAIQSCRIAEDAPRLQPQALGVLEPEALLGATLTFHPAARLFESAYPVEAIWRWHQLPEAQRGELDLDSLPASLVVLTRVPAKGIALEALAEGQYTFLSQLNDGKILLEASEAALALNPRFNLAEEMLHFLNAGIFAIIKAGG